MKTVTNSNNKAIIICDDHMANSPEKFDELYLIIKGLRLAESAYTDAINSFRKQIALIDPKTEEVFDIETLKQMEETACNDRRRNFAMIRKLEQIRLGFVDLDISPYILTTDLTTLRGWL